MLMALCVIYYSLVRTKKTPVAIHKAAMAPTDAIKAAINIFGQMTSFSPSDSTASTSSWPSCSVTDSSRTGDDRNVGLSVPY